MHRRTMGLTVALLGAVVTVLALSACGGGSSSSSSSPASGGSPVKGGTLIVSYQGEPQYLDPAVDWEGNGWSIEHSMFNTLLTYASGTQSAGTKLVPDLATAMPTVSNGGKTYTFTLRKGIKFAPPVNRELTAADWKWSFERMMSPKTTPTPPGTGFYTSIVGASAFNSGKVSSITGVKVLDPYTLQIDLVKPDATILYALTMAFTDVMPKEWVQKWGKNITRHPLGTGPYVLDHWTTAQEIVLKRNPNWTDWRGVGQAWVDGITVKLSINPSTALLKLKTGKNDILGDYIAPSDYVSVTHDPQWKSQVAEEPAIAIDYLFMNVQVKPFDNLKVRQAVSWAIDRQKTIKLISGAGSELSQIFPAGMPGHVDGAGGQFYGYDPTKAKQMLAAAGYPNGFSTTIYSHNVDPWPKVTQSIQNDLKQIGVKAQVKFLDRATYWTLIGQPKKVPMGLQDWWQDFPDPSDFIVPLFSKSNAVEGGANPSFWWDPQVEKLLAQSFGVTDQTQRVQTFQQIQKDIMTQAPAVPLYQPNVNSVFSKRVGGFYLHPVWIFDFLDYSITR